MPEITESGWPYPVGTDRVMDGDDMIKAVALLLEQRVGGGFASGVTTIDAPPAYDTPVHRKIAFPSGLFTAPPIVVVGIRASDPSRMDVGVDSDPARPVSADYFYATATRSAGPLGVITIYWIAHQAGLSAGPSQED